MGGFRIGRLAGIDIHLDWSLAIIFVLIMATLGLGLLPSWHPDWAPGVVWMTALVAALLFFVSILLHEMSHALVGRAHGMTVPRITLFVFGGMAHLEDEPRDWRAEFWMAIAGPVASLALGVLFAVLANLLADASQIDPTRPRDTLAALGPLATVCAWLAPINLLLAVFNMVPGFPLDGGRVLRAALWGITGRLETATLAATRMGQLVAWLLIGTGFAMMLGVRVPVFGSGPVGGLWLALIGWFLNTAARGSYHQLMVRMRLADVPVSRLMHTGFETVTPEMTIAELIDEHLLGGDQRAFPVVVEDGRLTGLITLTDVRRLPREARAETRVRDAMIPVDRLVIVRRDDPASEAAIKLSERGVNQVPVLDGDAVRGMVRREDVLKWLALFGDGAGEDGRLLR